MRPGKRGTVLPIVRSDLAVLRQRAVALAPAAERRDQATFEALLNQHWDRLYRYAYRLCGSAVDAEDLLAESILEAYQAFSRFRGSGFDRWLFRILTTNRIDQVRRTRGRWTESLSGYLGGDGRERERTCLADLSHDPARLLTEPLFSENVARALAALPENFRAPLLLCDQEELDYSEIAEILRVPIGTVRSRIHRARAMMRQALNASTL